MAALTGCCGGLHSMKAGSCMRSAAAEHASLHVYCAQLSIRSAAETLQCVSWRTTNNVKDIPRQAFDELMPVKAKTEE
jgi:hypothetical protein